MPDIILNPVFKDLRGRVGNLVFYKRLGKQCMKVRVIPHNPDTEEQRKTRVSFAKAVAAWQSLDAEEKLVWNKKARGRKGSGYNFFLSEYRKADILSRDNPEENALQAEEGTAE
jgi:hypothetical protein